MNQPLTSYEVAGPKYIKKSLLLIWSLLSFLFSFLFTPLYLLAEGYPHFAYLQLDVSSAAIWEIVALT